MTEAKEANRTLVVCFIRQVSLSYKYDGQQQLTIDTDLAALRTFSRFLDMGTRHGRAAASRSTTAAMTPPN